MHKLVANLRDVDAKVVTLGASEADAGDGGLDVVRVGRKGGRLHRLAVARLNAAAIWHAALYRPQVVVSGHAVAAPASAAIRALRRRTAVLQYIHGDEFRTRPGLLRFAVRRADAVIAVSRYTGEMALAAGCDRDRLEIVHPGVDAAPRRPLSPADRPTVLTVARLHDPYKGHDLMIRALPSIRERVPAVEWVVIGDGPLRPWLEDIAVSQGVADAVRFLGRVSDLERDDWLARAHIFAMPSRLPEEGVGGEGFGIVYLEAAANGLPVVAGAVGGALDAVEDGRTGRLVDPTDPAALADAIAELLLDPEGAATLGEAGALRARAMTWKRHAGTVERLIHGLVGARDGS